MEAHKDQDDTLVPSPSARKVSTICYSQCPDSNKTCLKKKKRTKLSITKRRNPDNKKRDLDLGIIRQGL